MLRSNQPVNTLHNYRREADPSYARGVGALAFSGAAAGGIWWGAHKPMPRAFTETFFRDPRMLGWGIREAGRTGLPESLIYARQMGLGEFPGNIPKWRYIDFAKNIFKAAEEISPSQIGRTFGIYEHLTAFGSAKGITKRFTAEEALAHRRYLSALTGTHIPEAHALGGMTLEGGALWLEKGKGGQRQKILNRAHLMMRRYVPKGAAGPETWHFGKIAPAYEELITGGQRVLPSARAGLGPGDVEEATSFMIGGGKSKLQAMWRYAQATTRTWTQRFFKLMDDPFLSMLEVMGHYDKDIVAQKRAGVVGGALGAASKLWDKAHFKNRFGLGGVYQGGTFRMFGRWLRPEMMKSAKVGKRFFRPGAALTLIGLPFAYHTVDQLLKRYGGGTLAESGIPGLAAEASEFVTKARAHTFGRVVGPYARWQEQVAPGSTDIFGVAALPLAAGLAGAFFSYAHRAIASITQEPTKVLERVRTPKSLPGFLGRMLKGKKYGRTGRWGMIGMAIGAAAALPMVPGAVARLLGGLQTPEELEEIYSGRQEVPIMASRWWTFGRQKFEGKKPQYYAPHWSVRARSDYMDEALFAGDESWLFKAIKKTPLLQDLIDPYYFEKLHYYDRPYPITGPSDTGLGLVDPIYKATIGRVLKPVRYMHTSQWQTPGGEPAAWEPRPREAPDPSLGGEAPYEPRDPFSFGQLTQETLETYSDTIGIVGWIGRLMVRGAVGQETPFDIRPEIEASRIASIKRAYWDASIGDPFGITEAYRRLNPRRDRGQYYNPIANLMPDWLPGEDYFINFQTGDPYGKVPRGEMRLPGAGYVALHPELEGVAPEDYSQFHRFNILADVAPYSKQYGEHNRRMTTLAKHGALSQQEQEQVKIIRKQVSSVKQRKQFAEYMTEQQMTEQDIAGPIDRAMMDYWDIVSRIETPVEQMMFPPIAPVGKFIHRRTALEDYEKSQVYGTDLSFWNRVYDNFLRPGIWRFANVMGYEGVPPHIRRQRDLEEYFDKLEYIKSKRLARASQKIGDAKSYAMYKRQAKETMTGMNPYGNPMYILRAMPKRERDYWASFREEHDPEKQARILELVPRQLQEVYRSAYLQRAAKDVRRVGKKGGEAAKDQAYSERLLDYVSEDMYRQGQPHSAKLGLEHALAVKKGKAEPHRYADWYRQKEVQAYFESHQLPDEGWIGWDPRVDLEDVKLKFVRQEGYDFHDYDLWEDRLYAMTRKPYLDEATAPLDMNRAENPELVQSRLRNLLESYDADLANIIPTLNGGGITMSVKDNQKDRFRYAIRMAQKNDNGFYDGTQDKRLAGGRSGPIRFWET